MKKVLLAVVAVLALNLPAYADSTSNGDFKSLAPKIMKAPKAGLSLKNQKDDVTIVYGGQDIARKITNDSFTA